MRGSDPITPAPAAPPTATSPRATPCPGCCSTPSLAPRPPAPACGCAGCPRTSRRSARWPPASAALRASVLSCTRITWSSSKACRSSRNLHSVFTRVRHARRPSHVWPISIFRSCREIVMYRVVPSGAPVSRSRMKNGCSVPRPAASSAAAMYAAPPPPCSSPETGTRRPPARRPRSAPPRAPGAAAPAALSGPPGQLEGRPAVSWLCGEASRPCSCAYRARTRRGPIGWARGNGATLTPSLSRRERGIDLS